MKESFNIRNALIAVALSFVCLLQTACCQVALPSSCTRVNSTDTKLECLVDPESHLRVQYSQHPDICPRASLQCSSPVSNVSCSLLLYEAFAQGCYLTNGSCGVLNDGSDPTYNGWALVTLLNGAPERAPVTLSVGAWVLDCGFALTEHLCTNLLSVYRM